MSRTWTNLWSAAACRRFGVGGEWEIVPAEEPYTSTQPKAGASSRTPKRWRATALQSGIILIAAIVPYLNALHTDFTFDDIYLIRDNAAVQVGPATALLTYVYHPGGLYRPLTMLTYAANASVGRDPLLYHAVNLVLHALVSVAVFLLAARVLRSRLAATVAALLFAVHPIHTEAVTGVVGRAELLAALGVLVSLLAFARSRDGAPYRRRWFALSLLGFAAAMLAKESAFTAVGLIAVLDWWIERGRGAGERSTLRRRLVSLLPYGMLAAAYLALRLLVVGALGLPDGIAPVDNPLAHTDTFTRLRTAIIVLAQYVDQLAIPDRLSADYSFNQIPMALDWLDPRFLAGAALFLILSAATVVLGRRFPAVALCALFIAIPLAVTANIAFPIGTIKGERLLYLPSVGWCLLLGYLVAAVPPRHARPAVMAVAALIALFGARTWTRNGDWTNDSTLFAATVATSPNSAKANHNSAVILQRAGRLDDAMLHYRRALEIHPEYSAASFGIGNVYRLKRLDAGALHWYEEALRRDPRSVSTHLEIALLHQRYGQYDAAEAAVLSGLEIEPNDPMLLVCLSAVRLAQGDEWRSRAALAQLDHIGTLDAHHAEQVAAARQVIESVLQ